MTANVMCHTTIAATTPTLEIILTFVSSITLMAPSRLDITRLMACLPSTIATRARVRSIVVNNQPGSNTENLHGCFNPIQSLQTVSHGQRTRTIPAMSTVGTTSSLCRFLITFTLAVTCRTLLVLRCVRVLNRCQLCPALTVLKLISKVSN